MLRNAVSKFYFYQKKYRISSKITQVLMNFMKNKIQTKNI